MFTGTEVVFFLSATRGALSQFSAQFNSKHFESPLIYVFDIFLFHHQYVVWFYLMKTDINKHKTFAEKTYTAIENAAHEGHR